MDIADIQREIEALPIEQQAALLNWLAEKRDRLRWDAEIERDFPPGGCGADLLDHVKTQVRRGSDR